MRSVKHFNCELVLARGDWGTFTDTAPGSPGRGRSRIPFPRRSARNRIGYPARRSAACGSSRGRRGGLLGLCQREERRDGAASARDCDRAGRSRDVNHFPYEKKRFSLWKEGERRFYTNSQLKCLTERIRFFVLTKPSEVRRTGGTLTGTRQSQSEKDGARIKPF